MSWFISNQVSAAKSEAPHLGTSGRLPQHPRGREPEGQSLHPLDGQGSETGSHEERLKVTKPWSEADDGAHGETDIGVAQAEEHASSARQPPRPRRACSGSGRPGERHARHRTLRKHCRRAPSDHEDVNGRGIVSDHDDVQVNRGDRGSARSASTSRRRCSLGCDAIAEPCEQRPCQQQRSWPGLPGPRPRTAPSKRGARHPTGCRTDRSSTVHACGGRRS